MTEQELYRICHDVREFLEYSAQKNLERDAGLPHFPSGCCDFSSELLAVKLQEKDPSNCYQYVCGQDELGCYHAWVECNGIIIDITADQFNGVTEKIIISQSSKFHKRYSSLEKIDIKKQRLMDATSRLVKEMP